MFRPRIDPGQSLPGPVELLIASLPRHPGPPTAAEERAYADRIARGGPDGRAARDEFIVRNIPLVIRIARGCRSSRPLADLVAAGCEGLVLAVDGFDPGRGTRFSTYAAYWIKRMIQRFVAADRLVQVPLYIQEYLRSGKMPSLYKLQGSVRTEACIEAGRRALAAVNHDSADVSPGERWPDVGATDPAELAGQAEAVAILPRALAVLRATDERLALVVELRYGLGGRSTETLKEIGGRLGTTATWVAELERQAIEKLRQIMGGGRIYEHGLRASRHDR